MTRDELKDLACLGFSADLVMQSFCHTAAYPRIPATPQARPTIFCAREKPRVLSATSFA
jgi:aconitase B